MDKTDRTRMAEVLGVEEDVEWSFQGLPGPFRVHNGSRQVRANGHWFDCDSELDLAKMINHPESIIRLPRLTEAELERCRVLGAKWVSMDENATAVDLWEEKPHHTENGYEGATLAATVFGRRFPSVKPGDCIEVEERGGQE